MSTLFLFAAFAGVIYLMFWMIQNDGAKRIADQRGLLRMPPPSSPDTVPEEDAGAAKRGGRPPQLVGDPRRAQRMPSGTVTPKPVRRVQTPADETGEIIHPLHQGRHPRNRR